MLTNGWLVPERESTSAQMQTYIPRAPQLQPENQAGRGRHIHLAVWNDSSSKRWGLLHAETKHVPQWAVRSCYQAKFRQTECVPLCFTNLTGCTMSFFHRLTCFVLLFFGYCLADRPCHINSANSPSGKVPVFPALSPCLLFVFVLQFFFFFQPIPPNSTITASSIHKSLSPIQLFQLSISSLNTVSWGVLLQQLINLQTSVTIAISFHCLCWHLLLTSKSLSPTISGFFRVSRKCCDLTGVTLWFVLHYHLFKTPSTIKSFPLWLIFDPDLLENMLSHPVTTANGKIYSTANVSRYCN